MRFAATEEEVMVQDMLGRALKEATEAAPRIQGHAPRPEPEALRRKLGDLGLWGAWLPEAAGGADGGPRMLMTLARGLGRVPMFHGLIGAGVLPGAILSRADGAEATGLASRLAAGETPVAVAAMEPGARWDLTSPGTHAEPDGTGVRLTGTKVHVADGASAEAFIISARFDGGIGLFLVPAEAEGLTVTPYPVTDGTTWVTLKADGIILPGSARLIGPDDGAATLDKAFTLAAFAASAEILGSCEAALTQTLDYLRTRKQFGSPLATKQALQFRAAELHTDIEMLSSQVVGAANALSSGYNRTARANVAAAMCLAVQTGDLVGREAIHMHGAIGMTRELGIGQHLLRADVLARWLGSAEHYRAQFTAFEEDAA